ncbi:helix-turn-helix domain-containing protein [Paenibacillus rhizovicinus]|uniref:helix-turn-helix domain-containing protein n=1 Tax=Paenibacillus rhizovicinus TaxID=2704463 RepID=UPI0038509452
MRDLINAQKITFRVARQNNNLSQSDVATLLGITEDTVEGYEHCSKNIPYEHAIMMFKLYGISSVHVHIE